MKESGLLALPAELRNEIYELVLDSSSDVPIYRVHPADTSYRRCPAPPLLQTCHKLRAEASAIFYGRNRFEIKTWNSVDSIVTLQMWVEGLRVEDWGLVKRVNLQYVGADGWEIEDHEHDEMDAAQEVGADKGTNADQEAEQDEDAETNEETRLGTGRERWKVRIGAMRGLLGTVKVAGCKHKDGIWSSFRRSKWVVV